MHSNPEKIEKIFGYNAIFTTSIEPQWGIELPVGCITIAGNAEEGNQFIPLQEQIRRLHCASPRIHLLDAKYDEFRNYEFVRKQGAIPLIDYNPKNEKSAREALLERGYHRNGWPYVPYWHFPTRPNGFDVSARRLSFSCFKHCMKSKDPAILGYIETVPIVPIISGMPLSFDRSAPTLDPGNPQRFGSLSPVALSAIGIGKNQQYHQARQCHPARASRPIAPPSGGGFADGSHDHIA